YSFCQGSNDDSSTLTIEKIMQDPEWIGSSPENIHWSDNGEKLFFEWNPEGKDESSLFFITPENHKPQKVVLEEEKKMPSEYGNYNKNRTKKVYTKHGDIYLLNLQSGEVFQITNTLDYESSPDFSFTENKIIYNFNNNLYFWNINDGSTKQLSNFRKGKEKPEKKPYSNDEEKWFYQDQMKLFKVLEERKEKRESRKSDREEKEPIRPKIIYTGENSASDIQLSPDEKYITYTIYHKPPNTTQTKIPEYVNESGYTDVNSARSKVGTPYFSSTDLFICCIEKDTVYKVETKNIPGIKDYPDFYNDYDGKEPDREKERPVIFSSPVWSDNGEHAVISLKSIDNKDRWIMLLDCNSGELKLLDHQHDEAWIGGPGVGWWGGGTLGWMPDNKRVYFQSEESGYSHVYTVNIKNGKKKALTSGKFEIYRPFISRDKKFWYFTSNEVHPGERHFFKMPLDGGKAVRLTTLEGRNDVVLSPDESILAIRHSFSNSPWELYLKKNEPEAVPEKITHSLTQEFSAYSWRIPEIVSFKAEDGMSIPARLYCPENPENNGPAVIFVHGAGYLQNTHKWWSSYYHEYMFHNFLVDNGYTVLDIDYRGSAGYGRDWRTAIYRHMGGKDLSDQVDGARFLTEKYNIDPDRIGIYGGSYGGFITLMAMFTEPGVFAAGAALRSVTDWAHYNHSYTANILNTPVQDSLAYIKSSPIYYAEGL
ncbi:MAG: prolyl oligopeptidase family serine peptidase, partial [Bacteroidales bacterium]|nr:prolyl oligopeptidase family serine peptidase [Bacteroidales bacterium]